MRLLIILGAALAGVLLFLLATASGNTTVFAQHYPLLLGLNAALAGLLAALVAWQIRGLWRKYRARAFGSRLTVRLLLLLALMAVVPGALVYTVSVQFLSKSIESWFDVKVDAALEGGISLGQSALDQMLAELQAQARAIAVELGDRPAQPAGRGAGPAARPGRRPGSGHRQRRRARAGQLQRGRVAAGARNCPASRRCARRAARAATRRSMLRPASRSRCG